jgi:F-type H+-transporting ATPase subunit gamma
VLQALAEVEAAERPATPGGGVHLVIGSERGFCGGFDEPLASVARRIAAAADGTTLIVAGSRLAGRLAPDAARIVPVPGSGSSEECAAIVDGWIEAIQAQLAARTPLDAMALRVSFHDATRVREMTILPTPALPARGRGAGAARTLGDGQLLPPLKRECLRVLLLGACYASLAQENRWRLLQMQRAQDHLDDASARLRRKYFLARQTDITTELETLMSSLLDAGPGRLA